MKSITGISRSFTRLFLAAAFIFAALAGYATPASAASGSGGFVYTQTNAAAGNSVLAYARAADGSLSFAASYPTGGLGTGASLGSQGSLVLTPDNKWLLAVDAGSNQVSVFAVNPGGLALVDVTAAQGLMPVSLTTREGLVYVLNEGGSGSISGFALDNQGHLTPLAGSTRFLSNAGVGTAPGGAEIAFAPDGYALVVTEKATNMIDIFALQGGIAAPAVSHPAAGITPYGFAFNSRGTLVTSEAFGGAPGASALSSYIVKAGGFSPVSASVATTQTAACWVVISNNGKFAYTTNAGSASISSYAIGKDGSISLLAPVAGSTGAAPVDMAIGGDGAFLYALSSAGHTINAFGMQSDGSLAPIGAAAVPAGVGGLAATN